MKISHKSFVLLCLLVKFAALYIFFKGFFPIKRAIPGRATIHDLPIEPYNITEYPSESDDYHNQPAFGKLVIVLIDALRADFVFGEKAYQHMPFTHKLIQDGKTLSFLAKAHPPTVTMPRLKAITTGGIPGFVDVMFNMDSTALLEDNVISQLYHSNKKIVFYGDDTWIKLFPDYFSRSDGTTSFFVTDYTEVDNNVTRHVEPELRQSDWDVMILHYLGLDHIGHLAGPTSPLVEPKLQEMDKIVEQVLTELGKQDSTKSLPSLVVLCGDHGMSDVGSHGGASASETITPLVLMSSAYSNKHGQLYTKTEVKQIDVAPTLSLLLGLPIPQNSLGRVITQSLHILPIRNQLRVMQLNAYQLTQVLAENVNSHHKEPGYLQYDRAVKLHASWLGSYLQNTDNIDYKILGQKVIEQYRTSIHEMSNHIAASLAKYDEHAMIVAILLFWQVLCSLLYGTSHLHKGHVASVAVPIGEQLSIFIVIGCGLVITSVHVKICTDTSSIASEALCQLTPSAVVLSAVFVMSSTLFISVVINKFGDLVKITSFLKDLSLTNIQTMLVISTVLHTFSLLSSSFVEEEHQTWYFYTMTLNLYFVYKAISQNVLVILRKENSLNVTTPSDSTSDESVPDNQWISPSNKGQYSMMQVKETTHRNMSGENVRNICVSEQIDNNMQIDSIHEEEDEEIKDDNKPRYQGAGLLIWAVVMAICGRLLRAWNQTGIKSADRADVGDWFVRPENKLQLSILVIISCVTICVIRHRRQQCHPLLVLSIIGIYYYRATTGILSLPWTSSTEPDKGLYQAWLVYATVGLHIMKTVHRLFKELQNLELEPREVVVTCLESIYTSFIILAALLLRPHNSAVLALLVLQEHAMTTVMWPRFFTQSSAWIIGLLHVWFGLAAFYAQGNSNNAATVDISAGYVGLESHIPIIVGLLTFISTYIGPMLWMISLLIYITKNFYHRYNNAIQEIVYTLALFRALPLAIYTVVVSLQRYHLFVWSVFSPKLMYEGVLTMVYALVIFIFIVHSYILEKFKLIKLE
ncbi:GPI ethanolamine phosphate transferase 2, catalytic subunit-like [Glandiceps talaboti]